MNPLLAIRLSQEPLTNVETGLAIAGFFSDQRPLRSDAGRADWRLCGMVSELLAAGRLEGRPGEAVLVQTHGRISADRLMLLGLGARAEFQPSYFVAATRVALERSVALGAQEMAMAPLGGAETVFESWAEDLLRAALDGLAEAPAAMSLTLALGKGSSATAARAALGEAADHLGIRDRIAVQEMRADPAGHVAPTQSAP